MSEQINAKEYYRPRYREWFDGGEIGDLALDADFGGAKGGECRIETYQAEHSADDYLAACPKATCPICNFCFKYHHPKDRHGDESDIE